MPQLDTLKTATFKAYNLLPTNSKHLASSHFECSETHFRKIIKGKVTDVNEYLKALGSIKSASDQALKKQEDNHTKIIEIVTKELKKIAVTDPQEL